MIMKNKIILDHISLIETLTPPYNKMFRSVFAQIEKNKINSLQELENYINMSNDKSFKSIYEEFQKINNFGTFKNKLITDKSLKNAIETFATELTERDIEDLNKTIREHKSTPIYYDIAKKTLDMIIEIKEKKLKK